MEFTITVIGGGSVNWMPTLMRDLYLLDSVDGGEIRLVDPGMERAHAVKGMLEQFNKQRNKNYRISVHADRREALPGTDVVLCTFSPGGIEAYHYDLQVPMKYGIIQPVSGTVGPCGISNALRTVTEAYDIVADMEELCPQAWMISETNPMTAVTKAMNLAAKNVRVIGMCHEFHAFGDISKMIMGFEPPADLPLLDYLYEWLPQEGFDYTIAGINHFIWLTKAELHGEDVLPRIRAFAEEHANNRSVKRAFEKNRAQTQPEFENWAPRDGEDDFDLYPWENHWEAKLAACRRFGHLSIGGDRHMIEFIPSFCNSTNGFGMQYGVNRTTGDHRKHLMDIRLEEIKAYADGSKEVTWLKSPEEMTTVLNGILTDTPTPCIVNLPNTGQISNMPEGAIVETFATVNGSAVTPKDSGALPSGIATYARLHNDIIELTVQAGLEGNMGKLKEALSLDPLCGTMDFRDIDAMAEDMVMATRKWLTRF